MEKEITQPIAPSACNTFLRCLFLHLPDLSVNSIFAGKHCCVCDHFRASVFQRSGWIFAAWNNFHDEVRCCCTQRFRGQICGRFETSDHAIRVAFPPVESCFPVPLSRSGPGCRREGHLSRIGVNLCPRPFADSNPAPSVRGISGWRADLLVPLLL